MAAEGEQQEFSVPSWVRLLKSSQFGRTGWMNDGFEEQVDAKLFVIVSGHQKDVHIFKYLFVDGCNTRVYVSSLLVNGGDTHVHVISVLVDSCGNNVHVISVLVDGFGNSVIVISVLIDGFW